jgi:hypothetical protein
MTIEEIKSKKLEAEKQISEILQKLHDETGCRVGVDKTIWEELASGAHYIVECRIELTMK